MASPPGLATRALFHTPTALLLAAALGGGLLRIYAAGAAAGARATPPEAAPPEPAPVAASAGELRTLYAAPSGRYTAVDIAANGTLPPSRKYEGLIARHRHAAVGERICPVTGNRADARFAWLIDGKTYRFCCPPCIDDFVRRARAASLPLPGPGEYVQR